MQLHNFTLRQTQRHGALLGSFRSPAGEHQVSQATSLSRSPTRAVRARFSPSLGALLARLRDFALGSARSAASSPAVVQQELALRLEPLLDQLEVTDAQRASIGSLMTRTSPQLYALLEQTREERDVLVHALFSGAVDHAEVERAQSELSVLADRGSELYVATLLELRSVLTPAQRRALAERLA
jgi:Spy/CpxP family protein refolding chaperone